MSERVTVKVPATTANLGPGFDCLGMALDIWNTVQVEVGGSTFEVRGEGQGKLPEGPSNLVYRSFRIPFLVKGENVPQVNIRCENEIPLARGLGSSSAAVIGGLLAGNKLGGQLLSDDELLKLAVETEGHPDNATPALLGGMQVAVQDGDRVITSAVPLPQNLRAVVLIPDVPISTTESRAALPSSVTMKDAVFNLSRVALLVSALSSGNLNQLGVATEDRLHQRNRQRIFPAMKTNYLDSGAEAQIRTGTGFPPTVFETAASTVPPLRQMSPWRSYYCIS